MTRAEARALALAVAVRLPDDGLTRLKAIDVIPRLHQGMLTIRVYMHNVTAPDPEPYLFGRDEL